MGKFEFIDPDTAARLRMSPAEAQAVAEMWALGARLQPPAPGMPAAAGIPPGHVIPHHEVERYLDALRAMPRKMRPARAKAADIRLAVLASAFLLVAVYAIVNGINYGRYRSRAYAYPQPMAVTAPVRTTSSVAGGMTSTRFPSRVPRTTVIQYSMNPSRYVFAIDNTIYVASVPSRAREVRWGESWVRESLSKIIGGPLADASTVSSKPLTEEAAIDRALARPGDQSQLIAWETITIAFGGKHTVAVVPYARIADQKLMSRVTSAQLEILARLVESAMALSGEGPGHAADTPAPPPRS